MIKLRTFRNQGRQFIGRFLAHNQNGSSQNCYLSTNRPRARRRRPKLRFTETTPENADGYNLSADSVSSRSTTQIKEMLEVSKTFIAKDNDGNELTMDEYLKIVTLSPWVPSPDPVARKVLEVAQVGSTDVHYELGSGDGRMNFHAIDPPFSVQKSVGIDIDASLIKVSKDRVSRRHPCPENIEFIHADLLDYNNELTTQIWDDIEKECTVLTMYFVEEALQKIKPKLEEKLDKSRCKIVTVGYPMKGWEPVWVEVILGLSVHLYVMNDKEESAPSSEDIMNNGHSDLSAQDLVQSYEEEELSPFMDKGPPPEQLEYDETEEIENYWDFDETETFDDDDEYSQGDKDK